QTPRPGLELLGSAGPKGVGGGEQHAAAFLLESLRQFGNGRGLSSAVHAKNQHDGRRFVGPRERRRRRAEQLDYDTLERGLIEVLGAAEALDDPVCCRDAEVRFYQEALHRLLLRVIRT